MWPLGLVSRRVAGNFERLQPSRHDRDHQRRAGGPSAAPSNSASVTPESAYEGRILRAISLGEGLLTMRAATHSQRIDRGGHLLLSSPAAMRGNWRAEAKAPFPNGGAPSGTLAIVGWGPRAVNRERIEAPYVRESPSGLAAASPMAAR